MRQEICFVDFHRTTELVPMPDAYKFAPNGRLAWLQRLAWRMLHKFSALEQAYDSRMKVERRVIDADSFMERLYMQRESIFREFDRDARRLVIGSEDYAELMREVAMTMPFSFNAQMRTGPSREVLGLTIEVVPWVRGMVVLP